MPTPIQNADNSAAYQAGEVQPKVDKFGKKSLSPDDFVTLFIKQLQHQNPLKPADASQMVQQFAAISAISDSRELRKTMEEFQHNGEFVNSMQLIDKRIEGMWSKNLGQLVDGKLKGSVSVPDAADKIKVTIRDKDKNVVKEIDLPKTTTGGMVDFEWDGEKDPATHAKYDAGIYTISTTAEIKGKTEEMFTMGSFKVKSVANNPMTREVMLNTEGLGGIQLNEIIKIV